MYCYLLHGIFHSTTSHFAAVHSLAAFLLPIKKAAERPIVMLQYVMTADDLEKLEALAFLTFQKPERI